MTSLDDQLQIGRKRVDQVFRYLEALNRLRNPAKRQLDEQLWSLWLRGLPDHHSVRVGTISSATPGAAGVQVTLYFDPALEWQQLSFEALRVFERPDGWVRFRATPNAS